MKIKRFTEFEISSNLHNQIKKLRNSCFPDCQKSRSYYKQLPHFRFLVFEGEKLIGHMGVDHRVILIGETPKYIFGIIDLCIDINFQNKNIASTLLEEVTVLGLKSNIDFLLLFTKNDRVYKKNNFKTISTYCSWLRINDHKNYGVGFEEIKNEIMIKELGGNKWENKPIDFLGYLF